MHTTIHTETIVYSFDELSDRAKEKARDDYREGNLDYEWWDYYFEQFQLAGEMLGIDFNTRRGGKKVCIYFSGFSSQGDGACFEGEYAYKKGSVKAIAKEFPGDDELLQIAKDLQAIQKKHFYKLVACNIRQYGHYFSMSMDVEHSEDRYRDIGDSEEGIKQALRDFASWIYSSLEKEYDYLNSDEAIDPFLQDSYQFTEDGGIF